MPCASSGPHAGWWPLYAPIADPHVRPRTTSRVSADRRPFDERRSAFVTDDGKRVRNIGGAVGAAPRPQFSRKITWEENLKLLEAYVAREGNAMVPLEHEEEGVRLGVWLSKQWTEYQASTTGGYLSRGRKLRLEAAGVVFNGPAPPASGVVGAHTLNDRKWDKDRSFQLASDHPGATRAFDTSKPASEVAWRPYSAETDRGAKRWLERQRRKGLAQQAETKEEYVPLAIASMPPVRGLDKALAQRLAKANEEMTRENAKRAEQRVEHQATEQRALAMGTSERHGTAGAAQRLTTARLMKGELVKGVAGTQ